MKNKGKQPRSRQTIKTILDAAAQVLIEHGYSKASTNRIADTSGYSVGTLYQYFEDKEDVYRELVEQELAKIVAAVNQTTACPTLRETLANIMSRALQVLGNDPLMVQSLGQLFTSPFQEIRATSRAQIVLALVRILQVHRDEIVVEDLQLAAETIVSATEGFGVNASSARFPASVLQEHAVRLQLAYLTMR